jgi:tryptophan 2,3-dioxygenase
MHQNKGPVYYSQYLMLDKLLSAQEPLSRKYASPEIPEAHDEMLFIVVHQSYEIWFKQMLHDLNSILDVFNQPIVQDQSFGMITNRLNRITKIQRMILGYMDILETMTPMEFLEFRNLLIPASGFQSTQFREIEIKLGLKTTDRESVDREFFLGRLSAKDKDILVKLESESSLFDLMEKWLERTPYTNQNTFNFWEEYKKAIHNTLEQDRKTIETNAAGLTDENKKIQLENLKVTEYSFLSLFDKDKHDEVVKAGKRKLSQKAILNALFILLYRDEPMLSLPHKMISLLMDIDENFTTWRYRHALMAQRMLGTKIGTGGSSGHEYLKKAADTNKAFKDLFNLSTYILPKSLLPQLPEQVKKQLNFQNV